MLEARGCERNTLSEGVVLEICGESAKKSDREYQKLWIQIYLIGFIEYDFKDSDLFDTIYQIRQI